MKLIIVIAVLVGLVTFLKFFRRSKSLVVTAGIILGIAATIGGFAYTAIHNGDGMKGLLIIIGIIAVVVLFEKFSSKLDDDYVRKYYHGSMKNAEQMAQFVKDDFPGVPEEEREKYRKMICRYGCDKLADPYLGVEYVKCLRKGSAEDCARAVDLGRSIAATGYIPAMPEVIEICWEADYYDFDLEAAKQLEKEYQEHPQEVQPYLDRLLQKTGSYRSLTEYCRLRNAAHCLTSSNDYLEAHTKFVKYDDKAKTEADIRILEQFEEYYKLVGKACNLTKGEPFLMFDNIMVSKFSKVTEYNYEDYRKLLSSGNLTGYGDIFLINYSKFKNDVHALDDRLRYHKEEFSLIARSKLEKVHVFMVGMDEIEQSLLDELKKETDRYTRVRENEALMKSSTQEPQMQG